MTSTQLCTCHGMSARYFPRPSKRQGSSVVEQGTHKPLVGSSTLPLWHFLREAGGAQNVARGSVVPDASGKMTPTTSSGAQARAFPSDILLASRRRKPWSRTGGHRPATADNCTFDRGALMADSRLVPCDTDCEFVHHFEFPRAFKCDTAFLDLDSEGGRFINPVVEKQTRLGTRIGDARLHGLVGEVAENVGTGRDLSKGRFFPVCNRNLNWLNCNSLVI